MKSKFILSILTATIAATFLLHSCKKDVAGCMDSTSINYNANATKDDGSCKYNGKVVFWWDKAFADSAQAYSTPNVRVSINGTFQGTLPVGSQYWNSAPSCGATGALTSTVDMGSNKSTVITIKFDLLDASSNVVVTQSYTATVQSNTCNTLQLPD
jgi:hypothetical protein